MDQTNGGMADGHPPRGDEREKMKHLLKARSPHARIIYCTDIERVEFYAEKAWDWDTGFRILTYEKTADDAEMRWRVWEKADAVWRESGTPSGKAMELLQLHLEPVAMELGIPLTESVILTSRPKTLLDRHATQIAQFKVRVIRQDQEWGDASVYELPNGSLLWLEPPSDGVA